MNEGEVVQIGSPVDLFERPAHTFVGHFIGSPGMNVLPCEIRDGAAFFDGRRIETANRASGAGRPEIGVRPEFVTLAAAGLPAEITRVADVGRHRVVEARAGGQPDQCAPARGRAGGARPGAPRLRAGADPDLRRRLAGGGGHDEDREPEGLVVRAAGSAVRRLQRADPADDGGQLFGAGDLRRQHLPLDGRAAGSRRCCGPTAFTARCVRSILFTVAGAADRGAARPRHRARDAAQGAMGLGLPGADGAAAPDPVERGRRDVEHHGAAGDRPPRQVDERARHPVQLHPQPGRGLVHHRADGRLALDLAGGAALLRRPRLDPRRLLPGRQDRRRPALGGLPLHPAAEAAATC